MSYESSLSNPILKNESNLKFDDSRIKSHPDKLLLSRVGAYFLAFASGDYDGLRAFQAEEYDLTDISKSSRSMHYHNFLFCSSPPFFLDWCCSLMCHSPAALAVVRAPKRTWVEHPNLKGFVDIIERDQHIQAISLSGSALPGECAITEYVVWFRLKDDPPEDVK
jgi:hypothetical protein